jgi:adenosine deaminase
MAVAGPKVGRSRDRWLAVRPGLFCSEPERHWRLNLVEVLPTGILMSAYLRSLQAAADSTLPDEPITHALFVQPIGGTQRAALGALGGFVGAAVAGNHRPKAKSALFPLSGRMVLGLTSRHLVVGNWQLTGGHCDMAATIPYSQIAAVTDDRERLLFSVKVFRISIELVDGTVTVVEAPPEHEGDARAFSAVLDARRLATVPLTTVDVLAPADDRLDSDVFLQKFWDAPINIRSVVDGVADFTDPLTKPKRNGVRNPVPSMTIVTDPTAPLPPFPTPASAPPATVVERPIREIDAPVDGSSTDTERPVPSDDLLLAAPKVLLHDHLDGGLRPATVVDLATEFGYSGLPTKDVQDLATWFHRGAKRNDLVLYLETFAHTVGVMQHRDAIERVAYECAIDLANDGCVYAEVRFAPELHTEQGLTLDEVVQAVLDGFARGSARTPLTIYAICSAMRTAARSQEIAEVAVRFRDQGVVGFDIAGAEAGHPPTRHLDAFQYVKQQNFHATIHAGEAFGLPSIWEALQWCGAERLGHGVRITDDITLNDDGTYTLGQLSNYVRDRRIPLELCPTSNVNTGVCDSIAEHPINMLRQLKFRVTVNTDNRLMSDTSMTGEFRSLRDAFGYDLRDFQWLTVNAMKSAFAPFDERLALINDVIKPTYARLQVS